MFETIVYAVALLVSTPLSILVWKVSNHISTIRQLTHQSSLVREEDEARALLVQKGERERALAGVTALEREHALEQKRIKAERDSKAEEEKAAAKAVRDEEQRLQKIADEAKKAQENEQATKLRKESLTKNGHTLWRMHTKIIKTDSNGYRVDPRTYYDWECSCTQRAAIWIKTEAKAVEDFKEHQMLRKDHRGEMFHAAV